MAVTADFEPLFVVSLLSLPSYYYSCKPVSWPEPGEHGCLQGEASQSVSRRVSHHHVATIRTQSTVLEIESRGVCMQHKPSFIEPALAQHILVKS